MPVKEYIDPDGGGFVHLVDTPFVCPPGTMPELDQATGTGSCQGTPTGPFRPPPADWEPPNEALVAPVPVLPPQIIWEPPAPPLPPPPPAPPQTGTPAAVGILGRVLGFVGGILFPSDTADSDLGIVAPPGGFREPDRPGDPRLPYPEPDDFAGFIDLGPGNSFLDVRAPPTPPRDAPLPSAFVAPPEPFNPYAPGLPGIYSPWFVPYDAPLAEPDPSPPGAPPRDTPLAPATPLDPDEDDPVWPEPAPRIPLVPWLFPDLFPNIFTDPGNPFLPSPTPTFDPVGSPIGDPFAPPVPTPGPTPSAVPYDEPIPLIPGIPTLPFVPTTPALPSPLTPGMPAIDPGPALFADPLGFGNPQTPRDNCPPCADGTQPKKKRKKRQPRTECWRGTYRETAKGLIKNRGDRVPCR